VSNVANAPSLMLDVGKINGKRRLHSKLRVQRMELRTDGPSGLSVYYCDLRPLDEFVLEKGLV